jgi:hypothetical protein
MRPLLLALLLAVLTAAVLPASAPAAAMKACAEVRDPAHGSAYRIRLSPGFSCRDARTNLGSWLGQDAPDSDNGRPLVPGGWRCGPPHAFGEYVRYRCTLRTSFGGTRPLRTFVVVFRWDPQRI